MKKIATDQIFYFQVIKLCSDVKPINNFQWLSCRKYGSKAMVHSEQISEIDAYAYLRIHNDFSVPSIDA